MKLEGQVELDAATLAPRLARPRYLETTRAVWTGVSYADYFVKELPRMRCKQGDSLLKERQPIEERMWSHEQYSEREQGGNGPSAPKPCVANLF